MDKNNIKQHNVYISEEEKTLNWEEIQNSFKKSFGNEIYSSWLQKISLVKEYLSPNKIRRIGVLNEHAVKQELNDFYRYRGGRAEKIMLMLNFQMWAERWL